MIVRGEPASGKTTFVRKVCKDWSELHLNEEPVRSQVRDVLGSYDLVIPVILRLVEHGASMEDTIRDQLLLDDEQMFTLHDMLKNTERTVIIMDGLDEYPANRSCEITEIMQGKRFKHIIITTRPEAASRSKEWKKVSYKEAELLGLTDDKIKLYVEKFFKESTGKRSSLISYIFQKDSQLLELARNVGSLCMICTLHCDGIPIHTMNREQLYEEYVAFRLSSWEQRQNPEWEKTPRSEILKKHHEKLIKFGELASINRKPYNQDDNEYNSRRDDRSDSEEKNKSESDESSDNEDKSISDIDESSDSEDKNKSDSDESSDSEDKNKNDTDESSDSEDQNKSDSDESSDSEDKNKSDIDESSDGEDKNKSYSDESSDSEDKNKSDSDDKDSMELSFTTDQIKSIMDQPVEDVLHYGLIYRSHPASRLLKSQFSFRHKTLHEFFLAYFIKTGNIDSFKQRLYRNWDLLKQELSLTRFLLHLYMSKQEAFKFTTNIMGSKSDKKLFFVLLKLYQGYQHDEYQTTLTFNDDQYCYIYQYPCYVIHADRRHQDSLSSYNKDMKRRMNTDNKHKALTVPVLQTVRKQGITCDGGLSECKFNVCSRPDYEVSVTGDAGNLKELHLENIEKVGDINLNPVNDRLEVNFYRTNLHGCVGLSKPWMALIKSLEMIDCWLEAGDISVMANNIQACTTSSARAESASPCRLQKLNLFNDTLTGSGPDIARIIKCIPLCTEITLSSCHLNDEDFHAIVNAIIQTHSDRHTSVHDHSTPAGRQTSRFKPASPGLASHTDRNKPASPGLASHTDRRQTSRNKPTSPGPASHIKYLYLESNKFSDVETVRLLFDSLPPSLRQLSLVDNRFNKKEEQEIRRIYKDKKDTHPNLHLWIKK